MLVFGADVATTWAKLLLRCVWTTDILWQCVMHFEAGWLRGALCYQHYHWQRGGSAYMIGVCTGHQDMLHHWWSCVQCIPYLLESNMPSILTHTWLWRMEKRRPCTIQVPFKDAGTLYNNYWARWLSLSCSCNILHNKPPIGAARPSSCDKISEKYL